jgi:hypothetical protein
MDVTTKIIELFGDDGKHVNIQFAEGGWKAVYNDGVLETTAIDGDLQKCCESLYTDYCEFYSPKRIAEELYNLIGEIGTKWLGGEHDEVSINALCNKRDSFIRKNENGEFVWKNVNPNFKDTLNLKPSRQEPVMKPRTQVAEESQAPKPKPTVAMPPVVEKEIHATDGYPDYFMKKTKDFLYTDCYGVQEDGGRILVKINRFDYSCTEIVPNVKIIPNKDEIDEIAKDEFISYYREAEGLIKNRKFYTPIDYNNVEIIKD